MVILPLHYYSGIIIIAKNVALQFRVKLTKALSNKDFPTFGIMTQKHAGFVTRMNSEREMQMEFDAQDTDAKR